LLWDVLNLPLVGGIVTNPSVKNDILHKIIIVTGTDRYQSAFGAGEVDPFFGNNQIMRAYGPTGGRSARKVRPAHRSQRQGRRSLRFQHRQDRGQGRRQVVV
jgi:hypothetical protein